MKWTHNYVVKHQDDEDRKLYIIPHKKTKFF